MSQLHLPARHTDEDLALAGSLAQLLNSGDLYVAWSTDGGAAKPVIPATVHAHAQEPLQETPVPPATVATATPTSPAPARRNARRGGLLSRLRARRRR